MTASRDELLARAASLHIRNLARIAELEAANEDERARLRDLWAKLDAESGYTR